VEEVYAMSAAHIQDILAASASLGEIETAPRLRNQRLIWLTTH
jgi:hypothetical protein